MLLEPLPTPIAWGCNYESVAIQKYLYHMNDKLKKNVTVRPSGFIVHPEKGWLGTSPDGIITDPTCEHSTGLLEIKCPYTKRYETPQAACSDSTIFCELINSDVVLKQNHAYYHQ
uniref:YqaJ viral recombinase domain-containing protein n=1 Tax=Amphimedon queenslandica TaxID=400682 RepID=A0A1X7UBD6_AMPQE